MGKAYDTYYGKAIKAHKDGYYVVEFISKEDFYNARNKILQELMSETYE